MATRRHEAAHLRLVGPLQPYGTYSVVISTLGREAADVHTGSNGCRANSTITRVRPLPGVWARVRLVHAGPRLGRSHASAEGI